MTIVTNPLRPLYWNDAGVKSLIVIAGQTTFTGNDSDSIQVQVTHGLQIGPSRLTPVYFSVTPATVSPGGTAWSAQIARYAVSDQLHFFVAFFTGTDPTATESVTVPGESIPPLSVTASGTDSNGDSVAVTGVTAAGTAGSTSITVPSAAHYKFSSGGAYTFDWIAYAPSP